MGSKTQSPIGLQPKLRFPEFQGAEGWQKQPLEKFLDYQQPTPYLVADTKYSNSYETPVLTAGKTFLLGYTNEQHGIFKDGLPVIIFDDFTTATQFVDFPFKAKSSAMKILQAKNGASIKFMYETLQMISYAVGTHERHWISKFAPMQTPMPVNPKEQQKVADCLSSLDELITAQAQKVEALKAHKKGLMQLLFPAEGETLPKLRFPEFRDAAGWEAKTISATCRVTQGGTPDTSVSAYWSGLVQWLTPAEMGKSESKYITKTSRTITEEGLKNCSSELLPVSSIIISTRAPIGHLAINLEPMAINQGCHGLIPNSKIDARFTYYVLEKSKRLLNDLGSGNTFKELSGSVLKGFLLPAPDVSEQKKIADCLSSVDELITAQAQKVETLKAHKKGLMQQLFPVFNEG